MSDRIDPPFDSPYDDPSHPLYRPRPTDDPYTETTPPSDGIGPLNDSPLTVALDAATEQFTRMPTSNPWDYAHAIIRALHKAELLARGPVDAG